MVNNFMSDSMVPLVDAPDAPEHGIVPLSEDEADPSFLIIVEASAAGGSGSVSACFYRGLAQCHEATSIQLQLRKIL